MDNTLILHSPYLQSVPEGESKRTCGLINWVVSRDAGTEENHVNQS